MNSTILKRSGVGVAAVVVAAALAIVPVTAASAAIVPTVGSAHPVYLLSDLDGTQIPAGTVKGWNNSVIASPDASDEDFNSKFAIPSGATSVRTFIAPRGQETTLGSWNAYGPLALTAGGIQLPNLKPSANTTAGLGSPSGSGAVANAGGDYSLGIAFLNGNSIIEADFTYITVVANANPALATWTFATPAAAAVAPAITTQPANATVAEGGNATFTAAASGSPAPSVKWQSAPSGSSTFTDIAGATSASLSVSSATPAQSGTQYRAVFTNTAGSATTNAATLTVNSTTPTQPTGSDAGKVTIADPAEGATSITLPVANGTYQVWAWSTPTNLGQVTVTNGTATVTTSSLAPGAHTVALTLPASPTVVVWGTFTIPTPAYGPISKDVDVLATVTASDLWSLNAPTTAVDFGNVTRGTSKTASLGKVTVVDDRNVLKGWDLNAGWTKFTNGGYEIPASAMTIQGKFFTGYTPVVNTIEVGTSTNLGKSNAVSTGTAGALFDADLTFTAPVTAQSGQYHSTLTLTLTSR